MPELTASAEAILINFVNPGSARIPVDDDAYYAARSELVTAGMLIRTANTFAPTAAGRAAAAAILLADAPPQDMVRVVVNLIVEVDANAWDTTFGTGTRRKDIVNDVREYVLNHVQGSTAITDECGGAVALR